MPQIGFLGPTYTSRSLNFDAQRTVNLYPEVNETRQGKSVAAFFGTPGLLLWQTLPGVDAVRALHTTGSNRVFAVRGAGVYEVFANATNQYRGSLMTTSGPVGIADNGIQLVFVDGSTSGFFLTLDSNIYGPIADPDFVGADRAAFLDQYLLFNKPGTQQFYWSDLSSVNFNALDFASAEGASDALLALTVHMRELWLFGQHSTEVWFDVGPPSVFTRIQGAYFEQGIVAPQSLASDGVSLYWAGQDKRGQGIIFRARSYQAERISTHAVECALQSYTTLADGLGWCQQQEGHIFYWLTFPAGNATWCFDSTTGLWHERAYRDPLTGLLGRHRANCYTYGFGKHLVGDYANGNLYSLDMSTFTDNGAPLLSLRRFPYLADSADLHWIRIDRLQLDIESGVGLDGSPAVGVDPQMMLRWSDDGAHTWSNEHWASAGKIGERKRRAIWRRLGRTRGRVGEISCSDPVKRVWLTAHMDMGEVGR